MEEREELARALEFELNLGTKLSPRFSVEKAHAMQLELSKRIIRRDMLPKTVRLVAGVDIAYAKGLSIGAVAVLDFDSLSIVESRLVRLKTQFPYIPTLLSFREIPPAVSTIRKLRVQPDVFLADGQGVAHPYRCGFASHLGLVLDKPTIGVAKSLLCGDVGSFDDRGWAPITDDGEIIGAAVVTNPRQKPVYVSIGHRVSLKRAISVVAHCVKRDRIPEPIRMAHLLATEEKGKCL